MDSAWPAGFSNGEAQKGGADYPKFRPERYYLRQTFGLGGEQEEVADAANQLAGKRDIDRVTLTSGALRSATSSTATPTQRTPAQIS